MTAWFQDDSNTLVYHQLRNWSTFAESETSTLAPSIFLDTQNQSYPILSAADVELTWYKLVFGYKSAEAYGGKLTLCDVKSSYVDVDVGCNRSSYAGELVCTANRMRHTFDMPIDSNESSLNYGWGFKRAIASDFPNLIPATHPGRLTTLEQYIQDPPSSFEYGLSITYDQLDMDVFEARLAMLLNTFWRISMNQSTPLGLDGVSLNRTDYYAQFWGHADGEWQTLASRHYKIHHRWFTLFTTATAVMTACAVANIALRTRIRAPDILGAISTLTRDTPFVDALPGGSTLDGASRAKLLKDKWVRLQDVKPEDSVGRIAFSDDKGLGSWKLTWERQYE